MPALAAVARLPGMHVCFVLESSSSGQVCACMTMLGGGGWLLGPSGPAVELVPLAKSKTLSLLEAKRSGKGMLSLRMMMQLGTMRWRRRARAASLIAEPGGKHGGAIGKHGAAHHGKRYELYGWP